MVGDQHHCLPSQRLVVVAEQPDDAVEGFGLPLRAEALERQPHDDRVSVVEKRPEVGRGLDSRRRQFLPNAETLVSIAQVLQVSVDFLLTGDAEGEVRHELPISDVPLLERFRDVQKLSKRDRDAVLLLIDSVLARSDVEARLRKRAS